MNIKKIIKEKFKKEPFIATFMVLVVALSLLNLFKPAIAQTFSSILGISIMLLFSILIIILVLIYFIKKGDIKILK